MAWVRRLPALCALLISVAAMIVVGCGRDSAPAPASLPGSRAVETADEPPAPRQDPNTLLADLPTGPESGFEGALVISGQMIGYHEPCGCSASQKGGLVRRAAFIEMLRKRGWNLGLLDLGTLVQKEAKNRAGPVQAKLKYAATLQALQAMGYGALAVSVDDFELGTGEAIMQIDLTFDGDDSTLKAVSANAELAPGLGFQAKFRKSVVLNVGKVRVGVTSIADPAAFQALLDSEKEALITFQDPEKSLVPVLEELEGTSDIQVLLAQGPPELARKLAAAFPALDVVVETSPYPDPPAAPDFLNEGRTMVVSVGQKGMYLGVIGLYPGRPQALEYRRVVIDETLDSIRPLAGAVQKIVGDEFQSSLRQAGVLESFKKHRYGLFDAPADAAYVGATTCQTCHPKTFEKWSTTKHAKAYDAIVNDPRDNGRNRENDAACVSCHTTGFEFVGGFVTREKTPNLLGNQCENCHGPGSRHAAAPDDLALRATVRRSSAEFDRTHRCIHCHDEDNDPKFDFAKYWPQIVHNKLDTYANPRVHKGITAPAN